MASEIGVLLDPNVGGRTELSRTVTPRLGRAMTYRDAVDKQEPRPEPLSRDSSSGFGSRSRSRMGGSFYEAQPKSKPGIMAMATGAMGLDRLSDIDDKSSEAGSSTKGGRRQHAMFNLGSNGYSSGGEGAEQDDDEAEHLLTGEERLKRAISAPNLSQLLHSTERQVNDDIKTSGVDIRTLVRVIYEDEFMQRTCRFIPVTLLFTALFMIFFQLHYLTTYTFLQEQNIRTSFTDAAAEVSTVGDVFAWMNRTMVPTLWSARNIEETGSEISSMGRNVLVGGIILRTAQGPEVDCQAPFDDWEGCYPAASMGGVEDQRVISKHSKYNGWESMQQDTSSLVRRLREEEPDQRFEDWYRLADQSLPISQRRLEGNWFRDLFYQGSPDPLEEEDHFEPEELAPVERNRQHEREAPSRVSGKGAPARRITGPFSNWASRGKKKRTVAAKTGRRLKMADSKIKMGNVPDYTGTFNVYQKVLPVSMTQTEVQARLSEWAQASGEGTQLLSKSTLFLTCEAILKNDDIGNGLTTQVYVHFVFSRGGHIYSAVEMRSMTQNNSMMALGVLFLWVLLMLGFTFYTPFRAFSALKHGACLSHFMKFPNFFEWVILLWGWAILAMFGQEYMLNKQFLADYDDYLDMRHEADQRTLVEFDESWLRRFSLKVRRLGSLDNQLVTAVAMYHLVLIFRFLVASRGQRRLAIVVNTIVQGFEDIMHLTVVLLLMILAYVFSGHILFGARMQDFATFGGSWGYVFQIVGQREYQWDDLIAGHSSIIVMIWLWTLFLVVILIVLNLVLAMVFDSYNEVRTMVSDKDTIWHTGLRLIYQLQSLGSWVPHHELRCRLIAWAKESKEDKIDLYRLKAICPKMPKAQVDLLFEDCQNRIKATVERGRKNMLSEALASILLGTEDLRRGVRVMKDWRQGISYFEERQLDDFEDTSAELSSRELFMEKSGSNKAADKEGCTEFNVVIDRTSGQKLGIDMLRDRDTQLIQAIRSDGLIQQWNENHPELAVKLGDRIVEINGVRNHAGHLQECKSEKVLEMVVVRGQYDPDHPATPRDVLSALDPKATPTEEPFWVSSGLRRHLRASAQQMENMYIDMSQLEAMLRKLESEGGAGPLPLLTGFTLPEPEEPSRKVRRTSQVAQPARRASRASRRLSGVSETPVHVQQSSSPQFPLWGSR